jgi:hypothetical protein
MNSNLGRKYTAHITTWKNRNSKLRDKAKTGQKTQRRASIEKKYWQIMKRPQMQRLNKKDATKEWVCVMKHADRELTARCCQSSA